MIRHIVWWTLKPEAEGASGQENARLLVERLEAFRHFSALAGFEISTSFLSSSTEAAQVVLQTTHDDFASFREYMDDVAHKDFVDFARRVIASRHTLDYEV